MAEAGPSATRPRRTSSRLAPTGVRRRPSAQLAAAADLAPVPSLLLRALAGDPLRTIAKLLPDASQTCFRLVCTAFRDHSSKPEKKSHVDFLCTRALATFAWEHIPGFVLATPGRMLHLAACVGSVGVLEELVDNRQCALGADASYAAAGKGHLAALAWLHSRGCPWDRDTCYFAAAGGHLEALRYAHEHGCPWDSETCDFAAGGGHLEVLRYAHEHGCPVNWENCHHIAAQYGHAEVMAYLRATQPAA